MTRRERQESLLAGTMDVPSGSYIRLKGAPILHTWLESNFFLVVLQLLGNLEGDGQNIRDGICLNAVTVIQTL